MANILTSGRTALLAQIEADTDIADLVKTWRRFGGGLLDPLDVDPHRCPIYSLCPGRVVEPDEAYNAAYNLEQHVLVEVWTEGDDPGDCEELVVLTLDRVRACRAAMLGLVDEGLARLSADAELEGWKDLQEDWLKWHGLVTVRLGWIRKS